MMEQEGILIADFGGQLTQLIARRLREHSIYCAVLPYHLAMDHVSSPNVKGLILSGGPNSIVVDEDIPALDKVWTCGKPILGICYGLQLLTTSLGGRVVRNKSGEFGPTKIHVTQSHPLFADELNTSKSCGVWMSHRDSVTHVPTGFQVLATSNNYIAAIADDSRKLYGVQFHPEASHSEYGTELLTRFAERLCGCTRSWNMQDFRRRAVSHLREQIGDRKVMIALSGGVDSSVAALLLQEAIGDRLICVFVDTGLLRRGEADEVRATYKGVVRNLRVVNAASKFFSVLEGISDPETKRKRIGGLFIDIFHSAIRDEEDISMLAQGTLYPDVIESISPRGANSATIKSHHNVGGLPDDLPFELVEPLRNLFKDEVRRLGKELELPACILNRHPFPGPGLAIRIPGEVTEEKVQILQDIDAIYLDKIHSAGLYDDIWQAFAVLLPVKSVGVIGDERSYGYACVLRAVTSVDGMTASTFSFSHSFLDDVVNAITNQVPVVTRVLYDMTSKPPGTIEWE